MMRFIAGLCKFCLSAFLSRGRYSLREDRDPRVRGRGQPQLAECDAAELQATLEQLADVGFDVEGLQFTDDELNDLLRRVDDTAAEDRRRGRGRRGDQGAVQDPDRLRFGSAPADLLERFVKEKLKCRAMNA
jgi:hypothetical protein